MSMEILFGEDPESGRWILSAARQMNIHLFQAKFTAIEKIHRTEDRLSNGTAHDMADDNKGTVAVDQPQEEEERQEADDKDLW